MTATAKMNPDPLPQWRRVEKGPLAGVHLFLPGGGCGWAEAIVTHNAYESAFLPTFEKAARTGGVLYDVGAHIGFFSCAWLAGGGNAVEVFEPVPRNQSVLLETFRRNGWGIVIERGCGHHMRSRGLRIASMSEAPSARPRR